MQTKFRVSGPQSLIDAFEVELKSREFNLIGNNYKEPTLAIYESRGYHKNYLQSNINHLGELYTLPKDWDKVMELIEPKVEYVRALKSYDNQFTKGKIYQIGGKYVEDQGVYAVLVDDAGINNGWHKTKFEVATKEEFDEQERIKVGDIVYVAQSCETSKNKVGDIGKVTDITEGQYLSGVGTGTTACLEGGIASYEPIKYLRKATAQEIEAYNSLVVETYKAEVKEGKIKFGCQYISKQTLLELKSLLANRPITIGETKLTEELLTKLINKL